MADVIKPPLGIKPFKLWIEEVIAERMEALNQADDRLGDWLDEHHKELDKATKVKYVGILGSYIKEMQNLNMLKNSLTN